MEPTRYNIHLNSKFLTEGRKRIRALAPWYINSGATEAYNLLYNWRKDGRVCFENFEHHFRRGGPAAVCDSDALILLATLYTMIAELLSFIQRQNLDGAIIDRDSRDDVYGDAKPHFDKMTEAVLNEVADRVNVLRLRTGTKHLPLDSSDTQGDALAGRMHNLEVATHLCRMALIICQPASQAPHEQTARFEKLFATVYRNYQEALVDRAKELEKSSRQRIKLDPLNPGRQSR
jgi:hypothetical protein